MAAVVGIMEILEMSIYMIDDQDVCDKWPKSLADKNNLSQRLFCSLIFSM